MAKKPKRAYRDDQIAAMKNRGLYPIPEMAALLRVAPSTVYRWLDDDKIEGTNVGAARYVRIKSVRKYIGRENAAILGL